MSAAEARRIALVIDYSLDYLGGAQSAFLDEARLLRARGHHVTIVAPAAAGAEADWVGPWRALGGEVEQVPARVTLPGVDLPVVRNSGRLRARLDRVFAAHGVEVVHTHSEFGLSAAAVSVARRRGLRTAQTVHTFFWQAIVPGPLGAPAAAAVRGFARWLRGFPSEHVVLAPAPLDSALRGITLGLARRVDVVVSPSAHQAARLREAGAGRVDVIPNALAADDGPGTALTSIDGPLRVVWVGRLVAEKRLLEWVSAVVRAVQVLGPDALHVEIVGAGPLRAAAERIADDAPIVFLGRLPRDRVQERMRAAHLVAITSCGFDNQPVTIVEALHARRGVLYVDPALTEGVEVAGVRVPDPGVDAMAQTLIDLARDPDRVLEVSQRAADGAQEFAPDRHVQRLLAAYELR